MIIDVRDYATTPGGRDKLIERCETLLLPEQERLGATMLGTFRDADNPDRFVWLRGAPDMEARKGILTAFYTDGTMWQENRAEVNQWIADSSNVLLVRPISAWATPATTPSVVGMYTHIGSASHPNPAELQRHVADAVIAGGGRLLVTLATDPSENNYPRHEIRTGETGFVWFASFPSDTDCSLSLADLTERRLLPTAHSKLR